MMSFFEKMMRSRIKIHVLVVSRVNSILINLAKTINLLSVNESCNFRQERAMTNT